MTIDKSGKWWRGTTADDLDAFLSDYTTSASYAANRFEHPRCTCGEDRFALEVDDEQGCARRTCAACGEQHFMLDSDEYSSDASLEECACPCGGETFRGIWRHHTQLSVPTRPAQVGMSCVWRPRISPDHAIAHDNPNAWVWNVNASSRKRKRSLRPGERRLDRRLWRARDGDVDLQG